MTTLVHPRLSPALPLLRNLLPSLLLALSLGSCSEGSDASDLVTVRVTGYFGSGTLDVSGPDTAVLGTTLTVGDVVLLVEPAGEIYTWIFVDPSSVITGDEMHVYPSVPQPDDFIFGDPNYGFGFHVIDDLTESAKGVSLTFFIDQQVYAYDCTTFDLTGTCGELIVDREAQTIDFVGFSANHDGGASSSTAPIVLDGTIRWIETN